jgi:DNA polymerase I-like protein with 3'-5' exonuclease and polymerase domains
MVGEYIRNGQAKVGYSLHESCKRNKLTGKSNLVSRYWGAGYETDEVPVCVLRQYNENDCRQVLGLYRAHRGDERLFKGNGETTSLVKLQKLQVQALCDIEQNGMVISEVRNERHIADTQATLVDLDARIRKITGRNLNIKSNDQRSALLFGGCYAMGARKWVQTPRGIKTSRDTLTKYYSGFGFSTEGVVQGKKVFKYNEQTYPVYNTDRDTINSLKCTTPEQKLLLTLLQERATLEKQLNTYYEPIKERQIGGVLHCNMNQTVTRTGRLSSSSPNLQNITRGSTSPVKECFITRYKTEEE